MHNIIYNPFRVIGILANSSSREILSRKGKITAYTKVGKEITSDYDFLFLPQLERNSLIIEKAFSDIEQNQNKVFYSLFWFINLNSIDNTSIQHLINGNKEKAIEIWEKLTDEKEVNAKNFSAVNNVATLYLLENSKEKIKQGITAKIKLIESEFFKDFVHKVADETFSIDTNKQIEILIDELLMQFKKSYSISEVMKLFGDCNGTTQKYLAQKCTEEPIHKIELQLDQTKKKRNKEKHNAYGFGLSLYNNTKGELSFLKSVLGVSNLQYKMLVDNVAKELLQCSIDYFNESQELEINNNYHDEAMKLAKIADSITLNKITKDRIKDNINTLEGMKDRELSLVINFLKSVKEAYEENEKKIRQEVKKIEQTDILIQIGHKTINWDAVEDNIKNSIKWTDVNVLLEEILSDNSLTKIKQSNKIELKKEFIELANWTKEHSLKKSTITTILEKYKRIPPNLPFKILSSEITNTDNKPLYTKFIRYVGVKLKLEFTENKTVEFYIKYINPNGSLKRNAKISPNGYTRSQTEKITIFTNEINFSGWGNADECIYDIGKHRIEIYVDEYLIHTKEFVVDIAPSEKIEKQLREAEAKLKEFKQKIYLQSEINSAKNELTEIQKFQLFRGSSEKQRQITNQQNKINELEKRSEKEKSNDIKNQEAIIERLKLELLEAKY